MKKSGVKGWETEYLHWAQKLELPKSVILFILLSQIYVEFVEKEMGLKFFFFSDNA